MLFTLSLFRRFCEHHPPLLPAELKEKMSLAWQEADAGGILTLAELENSMVVLGYQIWPWHKAEQEFSSAIGGEVAEHFLTPRLSLPLQEKYADFRNYGGTWHDLRCGRPAEFFTPEERVELARSLVDAHHDLRAYVEREVRGLGRKKYLGLVDKFKDILGKIKIKLDEMRGLADSEYDHPNLTREIQQKVKAFEHGLCFLAPSPDYYDVCQAMDFFRGRKVDLNRWRGIHLPVEVDFYN